MKKTVLALTLAGLFLSPTVWSATSGITLDGHSLTLEDAWEIAYSIKNKTRSNNSSKRNAILLVALPDRNGRYDYVKTAGFMFNIIENNRNNLVYRYPSRYFNYASDSYCLLCQWDQFLRNINIWIEAAVEIKEHAVHYQINTKF